MAYPQKKRTHSFSSSVLDSIYRSIDESDGLQNDLKGSINSKNENVPLSSSSSSPSPNKKDDKLTTLRRAIMDDEHWLYTRTNTTTTTNSSDSSAFSSSEAESNQTKRRSRKLAGQGNRSGDDKNVKAVKIHEELKSTKQPVSPGARLTSFLNSIFQSNAKKVKLCSVGKTTDVKCTSSRSCFSRTRCKTDNNNCKNLERSIRFYPVKVSIGGDYVHKNITRVKKPIQEVTEKKVAERVTSLKEEIKTKVHQSELTCVTGKIGLTEFVRSYGYEGKEEDDGWSYSSSDLFELDNHHFGMGRYIKELPVYETTDFKTNQAIARGLLL